MHLAKRAPRVLALLAAVLVSAFVSLGTARADRFPLLGTNGPFIPSVPTSVTPVGGGIVSVPPDSVPCHQIATFQDVLGGDTPGTNYDGLLPSGDMLFAERFVGQTLGYIGDFDAVSGSPTAPLSLQQGLPGQNLDVFAYITINNVLAGLGPLGYPDIDAIGEGSMAVYLPVPQSRVSLQLVGGNGGSATLSFYRPDGSLIGDVLIGGLAEFTYGFATGDGTSSIAGILIQNTDASGIGLDNVCHDGGVVGTRPLSWGQLKTLYR